MWRNGTVCRADSTEMADLKKAQWWQGKETNLAAVISMHACWLGVGVVLENLPRVFYPKRLADNQWHY